MRAKCDDNDDVTKIIMAMTMSMTTLRITMTIMMITTMAMVMPPFFLPQLRSVCRTARKSCNPVADAPVLAVTMMTKVVLMLNNDDICGYTYMRRQPALTREVTEIPRQGYKKRGQFLC